jgi:hypothetical protein
VELVGNMEVEGPSWREAAIRLNCCGVEFLIGGKDLALRRKGTRGTREG